MTSSSDSGDDHQVVKKNGHDQSQDRAIRELHHDLKTHIADEELDFKSLQRTVGGLATRFDKYLFGGRLVWGFVTAVAAAIVIYQASLDARVDRNEDRLDQLTTKQHAFEERGTRWGQDLDVSVSEIRRDIREIRNTINGNSPHKGK